MAPLPQDRARSQKENSVVSALRSGWEQVRFSPAVTLSLSRGSHGTLTLLLRVPQAFLPGC